MKIGYIGFIGASLLIGCTTARKPAEMPTEATSVTSDTTQMVRVGFTASGGVLTLAQPPKHYPAWIYTAPYPINAPTPKVVIKRNIKPRNYYGKNYRQSKTNPTHTRKPAPVQRAFWPK